MTDHEPMAAPESQPALSRRQFLQMLGVVAAGALAACAEAGETDGFGRPPLPTATEVTVLESPQPPAGEATAAPAGLERFLALSAALTGMGNLDPRIGAIFLEALGGNSEVPPLDTLYEQAGVAETGSEISMEGLRAAGVLDQEGTRSLAREIARMWYTGTYEQDGETKVATFVDALAFKSLRFTKPLSICASFGFWETRPDVDVSKPGRASSGT